MSEDLLMFSPWITRQSTMEEGRGAMTPALSELEALQESSDKAEVAGRRSGRMCKETKGETKKQEGAGAKE